MTWVKRAMDRYFIRDCMSCAMLALLTMNVPSVSGFVPRLAPLHSFATTHDSRKTSSLAPRLRSKDGAGPRPRRCGVGLVMMGRRAAKIANVKGREDAKRGKTFARIGKKIIMAVKAGGGASEESNKMLADAVKEAKRNNVPKDNIARAIKRAVDGSQGDFKEVVYEAYGHGGAGMVITALTDNVNRAIADVKTVWKKHDVKQAAQGSVLFQFDKKGRIEVAGVVDEEQVIEAAIEAGVDEVEVVEGEDEGTTWVLTDPKDLTTLADALAEAGITGDSGLALLPSNLAEVDDATMERNIAAVEALLELEDVDSVAHNMA